MEDTPIDTHNNTESVCSPDRNPSTISRYVQSISRVLYILSKENLTRTLNETRKLIEFLTPFQGSQYLKIIYLLTQFILQLGQRSRLDGKLVVFYNNPNSGYLPILWTALDDIFKSVKVHLPSVELLTTNTPWRSGNEETLFTQDTNNTIADL